MRICLVPSWMGKGWTSFLSQPMIDFTVEPKVNKINIQSFVENLIKQKVMQILQSKVLPIRGGLRVPLSKKSKKKKQMA